MGILRRKIVWGKNCPGGNCKGQIIPRVLFKEGIGGNCPGKLSGKALDTAYVRHISLFLVRILIAKYLRNTHMWYTRNCQVSLIIGLGIAAVSSV